VVCNHFLEHLDGVEQMRFMDELWRILKVGGKARIVAPYGWHSRAWQDPTHKRPIVRETFLYYNRAWREANRLGHYPIRANFDTNVGVTLTPELGARSEEYRNHVLEHNINEAPDIIANLVKEA
jgi:SAM-dependent methyltransferase